MADKSFLDWPFFEDCHRDLAGKLDLWCKDNIAFLEHKDVDAL